MNETEPKRLSPEAQEKLAQALRERLSRKRLRKWPYAALAAVAVVVCLTTLWFANQPGPPLPPLMLVAFDALEHHEGIAEAQLIAPSQPDVKLAGLEVRWWMKDLVHDEMMTTKTDDRGFARYRIGSGDTPGRERLALRIRNPVLNVSFLEPTGAYERNAAIRLTTAEMLGDQVVIVPLEGLVSAGTLADWTQKDAAKDLKPPTRTELKIEGVKGVPSESPCEVIYAAGDIDGAIYRAMKEWLKSHQDNPDSNCPAGPLLREPGSAIEKRLRDHYGKDHGVRLWQPAGK